ncbi:MAG: hypothetical protein L6R40_005820 [Gallowayella cf. fulva]|nr:MAG: hypothetical protein L6R40_005820 [Xanthomendoza cf. fulva]
MVLYAASRKGQDLGFKPASSKMTLKYPKLDIADRSSIDSFAKAIRKDHTNVDVLINNAGVNLDMEYSPANVETTLNTNYRGTLNVSGPRKTREWEGKSERGQMCQIFIPLLSKRGRIVNVSSTGSSLSGYSKEIQDRFRSPKMTLQDLEQMMNEYQVSAIPANHSYSENPEFRFQEAANNGTESRNGWKSQAYGVTKAAENAMTAVLARDNPGLIINACCPG